MNSRLYLIGFLLFAQPVWAQTDPVQQLIQRYRADMAAQREKPGPAVTMSPAMEGAAKAAIIAILKDPSSAQWGEIRGFQAKTIGRIDVCGMINAKNSLGGYVGAQPYHVVLTPAGDDWTAVDADIATPNRRGDFYKFSPMCNPAAW